MSKRVISYTRESLAKLLGVTDDLPCAGAVKWVNSRDPNGSIEDIMAARPLLEYKRWAAKWTNNTDLLSLLSHDPDYEVRGWVAHSLACPLTVLEKLVRDPDWVVKTYVARNPTCPAAFLEVLAKDSYWRVRGWAAYHPKCPIASLQELAKDPDEWVRDRARSNSQWMGLA